MSVESPSEPLSTDQELREMRFNSVEEVVNYLDSLGINPRQFARDKDDQLLSVRGTVLTKRDPKTGVVSFSEMGANATAEYIESLGWTSGCFRE